MNGWTSPRNQDPPIIRGAEKRTPHGETCPARLSGYCCTRELGHAGRHLAGGGIDDVYAAWPGDHEPTAADLTDGGA